MKKLYLSIFLLLLLSVNLFAQSKDRALYRFGNNILFLSEVNELIKNLEKFRCLNDKWESLSLTHLNKGEYQSFPVLPHSLSQLNENKDFILRFINLQKLKIFARSQLVKVDIGRLEKINKKRCFPKGAKSWSQEVKDLVKLELYLESRYKKNATAKNNFQERLKTFLYTITKKSNNVLFF